MLKIIEQDILLSKYAATIEKRYNNFLKKEKEFAGDSKRLSDVCNSYLFYGLHKNDNGWVFREWAPNATAIYIQCDYNDWRKHPDFAMKKIDGENWEIELSSEIFFHGVIYRLLIEWNGGEGLRLPSHATRAVQDEYTKDFFAEVWDPAKPYVMHNQSPERPENPLIYEAHIGMSTEHRRVSTYTEFKLFVLPRIADLGYNTIQLMAIQEHPYYGSFGYQVSNFFAVSSRFGTPDELKSLIDTAHGLGIRVIMDLVHSHSVSNEMEGLSKFDGTTNQYFYSGDKGNHPLWKSRLFDYGKPQVINFLLSNCKYWLEEFQFDGFRFDGITSMIYWDHGINKDFLGYDMYYDGNQDENAITYMTMANRMIHQVNSQAITIAEEVSGIPGLAYPIEDGGMGFDFRMSMGIPDYWIKLLKDKKDEFWHVGDLFYELTNKRKEEHTISYAESHDQALVGDQTIFFRLVGKDIYSSMSGMKDNIVVDRGIALHKMIRLITISTAADGYLNFMGNEWGHPEWIDFPRQDNGYSYEHARRQWSLLDDERLRYFYLNRFDKEMIQMVKTTEILKYIPDPVVRDIERQVLVFSRGNFLFVFNFSPDNSYTDYMFHTKPGKYVSILNTDNEKFNGEGIIDESVEHFTSFVSRECGQLSLYIPARTAFVLQRL